MPLSFARLRVAMKPLVGIDFRVGLWVCVCGTVAGHLALVQLSVIYIIKIPLRKHQHHHS